MLINEVESDEEEIPEQSAPKETEPAQSKAAINAKEAPLTLSPATTVDLFPPDSTSSQPSPISPSPSVSKSNSAKKGSTLESVIALHTSRRMQTPPEGGKVKQGVSIPSQRRFLGYWSRLIDGAAPPGMWAIEPNPSANDKQRVRLDTIRVTMRDDASLKQRGMKIINSFLDRAVGGGSDGKKGKGDIWVSLARLVYPSLPSNVECLADIIKTDTMTISLSCSKDGSSALDPQSSESATEHTTQKQTAAKRRARPR
jgi:phosphatidylinositol-3,4,5-trisphosphate 3-phosphatase/dual-specificity protein phosphatase PTEN